MKDYEVVEELMKYRGIWGDKLLYTKEESIRIHERLTILQVNTTEVLKMQIEAYIMESAMRHKMVFGSNIYFDALMDGLSKELTND